MSEAPVQGKNIRVLIADDHAIVREGLRWLITTEPGMELVAEAADGSEAVQKARTLRPDVIILDLVMPQLDGVAAIGQIKRENQDARILVLTSFADDERVFAAIKAGALGYLLKDSLPKDLLQGIRDVHRGELAIQAAIAHKLMRELQRSARLSSEAALIQEPLTEREVEVLDLVARGLSNQEIAKRLEISERTARTHVSNILDKLHLANRTQAALYALREGLTRLDGS